MGGSSLLNVVEIAKALTDSYRFNVTIICAYDVDIKESPLIHKYPIYIEQEVLFPTDFSKGNFSIPALYLRNTIFLLTDYLFV